MSTNKARRDGVAAARTGHGEPKKEESAEILQAIIDSAVDGIVTIDDQGIVQTVNPAAARIFGYEPEEILGQNVKFLMPDHFAKEHHKFIRNYQETGEAKIIGKGREVSGQRKDGSVFPIELSVAEAWVKGERKFAGILRDITDRRKAEKVMDEQRRRLIELSSPVLKVWDNVVLLPLVGYIDEHRTTQIIENLLDAIVENEALVAVIDVTGVPTIDTHVAQHLMKTISAAEMLGARVITTGISPAISATLVKLGIDFSSLNACGALKNGIAEAFKASGHAPVRKMKRAAADISA